MSIFPQAAIEGTVQVDDLFRIDCGKCTATQDEDSISNVEVDPGSGYISVYGTGSSDEWYLDYSYDSSGTKTINVKVTAGSSNTIRAFSVSVVTEALDEVLSDDQDLIGHESEILQYLRPGKATFTDKHRQAVINILDYLDRNKIWRTDSAGFGNRLTYSHITDKAEFKQWAIYETLVIIFGNLSNSIDDIFSKKENEYMKLRNAARQRASLRLDRDADGTTDKAKTDLRTGRLQRR